MFRGSSFHTIDVKGRLIIPARFRDVIRADGGERVMLSRMDGCLVAYPLDEWRRIESRILQLAQKNTSMRRFRRVFIGGAFDCACDKQERILIPPLLRDYAGLQKDVVLVGVLDHFEIWSRGKWEQENLNLEEDLKQEEVRNDIASLGL
ncbi:MAG: division/cell wall cluster transcriptional repressor MraZ [Desulfobacterales bacterium]|nr:division/cell wall cluster transcriptional repressor MraZ [Desulfobacterales bacterium]